MANINTVTGDASKTFTRNILVPYVRNVIPKNIDNNGNIKSDRMIEDINNLLVKFVLSPAGGLVRKNINPKDIDPQILGFMGKVLFGKDGLDGVIMNLIGDPIGSGTKLREIGGAFAGGVANKYLDAWNQDNVYNQWENPYA